MLIFLLRNHFFIVFQKKIYKLLCEVSAGGNETDSNSNTNSNSSSNLSSSYVTHTSNSVGSNKRADPIAESRVSHTL